MDTSTTFPSAENPDLAHFKTSCVSLDETDPKNGGSISNRMNQTCASWRPTGISLIAQHPDAHRNQSKFEYLKYTLIYENEFMANASVKFMFRAS